MRALPLLLLFVLFSAGEPLARVVGLEVYRQRVFVEEEFSLEAGRHRLPLCGRVQAGELAVHGQGLEVVSLNLVEAPSGSELSRKIARLEEEKEGLVRREELLSREISLLESLFEAGQRASSLAEIRELLALFEEREKERAELARRVKELERRIESLRRRVAYTRTTWLEVEVQGRGVLRVRYPAGKLVRHRESYRVVLLPGESRVRVIGGLVLAQRSGADWRGVRVSFHSRLGPAAPLSPPPFRPWYLDLPRPVEGRKKAAVATTLARRQEEPSGLWERLERTGVDLPEGREVFVPLLREELEASRVSLEVPAYARARAYFRADLVPDFSLPRSRASFYLDDEFLGEGWFGPLSPGRETTLYFGEAPLLEVDRKVLRDTTGHPFFSRHREVVEKVFRTTLTNRYRRPWTVILVDRRPVSRREEIKVKAEADPPWDEETPEGKLVWRFTLEPDASRQVELRVRYERPVK